MQPQVMQQLQHHMPQQMPPGLQQSHMTSSQQIPSQQSMQQLPQQSLLQQQMSQPHLQQQQRSNNNQGMVTGQQFAQGGSSSQHQTGIPGPMQMNYQGQAHTGPQPPQQPRNPMGQFTSRDGTMNVEYQQGGRGSRQQLQMGSQGGVVRNGMPGPQIGGQPHMGSQHVPDGHQMMTQQMGGIPVGTQQMSHQMGQASMPGQQYYMQQDQRMLNQPYNQYPQHNQF
ncbi:hypothetical protein GCK32_013486 [Trichostrongylus colubriformis]|uniref:Uncharacterized protein n=1 Tax=Trichostrongylus colubriformis TaxID=6319 RepID=A0AAN8FKR2_TRICO